MFSHCECTNPVVKHNLPTIFSYVVCSVQNGLRNKKSEGPTFFLDLIDEKKAKFAKLLPR